MTILIQQLMDSSGVKFGTSGARGLAKDMTDFVCYTYTKGFLQYLRENYDLEEGSTVGIAGDLRPSTDRIMGAVGKAVIDMGYTVVDCGKIPSPAIAYYGLEKKIPTIMVTGSHIPEDRNGIKFNKADGEILKPDEAGIKEQQVEIPDDLFNENGMFAEIEVEDFSLDDNAGKMYKMRYIDFFSPNCLEGKNIGVYQHSAVGRELVYDIFSSLGANVTKLGFSEKFIPVDTEAIRPEDTELARKWAEEYHFDAIVSTDGDSDRPLISDENGHWLRGDIAGILCAQYLDIDSISTPVSCNTAVEKCGLFKEIRRTRIGSPYVIESMLEAIHSGMSRVAGYEANGGFLLASGIPSLTYEDAVLKPLPTRDAMILLLSVILLAKQQSKTVSELTEGLPARFTSSDRLKNIPPEVSQAILKRFSSGIEKKDRQAIEDVFGTQFGQVVAMDRTDGLRITFSNQDVVHLRASGNAPEFRCYTESDSPQKALKINKDSMKIIVDMKESG